MSQIKDLPLEIALFPIRGCILPPGEHLPLNVFEPRYLNMIDDAMAGHGYVAMVQPRGDGPREAPRLERVATAGRIVSHTETQDGRYLIVLAGICRFTIAGEAVRRTPYRVARADYSGFEGDLDPAPPADGMRAQLLEVMRAYFDLTGLSADWMSLQSAPVNTVVDRVVMAAPLDPAHKQALLTAHAGPDRASILCALMEEALARAGQTGRA
jgi:Lon protease-like protein